MHISESLHRCVQKSWPRRFHSTVVQASVAVVTSGDGVNSWTCMQQQRSADIARVQRQYAILALHRVVNEWLTSVRYNYAERAQAHSKTIAQDGLQ